MSYTYALDPTAPNTASGLVKDGAADIREFKNAIIERLASFFTDVDANPLTVLASRNLAFASLALGTNPASTGTIRIPNASSIIGRNALNNGDLTLLTVTAGDVLTLYGSQLTLSGTGATVAGALNVTGIPTFTLNPVAVKATKAGYSFYNSSYRIEVTNATGVMDIVSNNTIAISIANSGTGVTVAGTLTVAAGGITVTSGGLTVSSGTSGLQAITGTTGVLSSTLTATRVIGGTDIATAVADGVFGAGTYNNSPDANINAVFGSVTYTTSALSSGTHINHKTQVIQPIATSGITYGSHNTALATHTSGTIVGLRALNANIYCTGAGGTTTQASCLDVNAIVNASVTVTTLRMISTAAPTINGTVTTAVGIDIGAVAGATTNYAIRTAGGNVLFASLPTSAAGLATGTIWNNLGILNIA